MYSNTVTSDVNRFIFLGTPLESFCIFEFLDDTGFRTTVPGRSTRRRMGVHDDPQRSFYSGYFAGHGLKLQALTLPNGMLGSIYLVSLRVSDSGLLNMSGLIGNLKFSTVIDITPHQIYIYIYIYIIGKSHVALYIRVIILLL